MKTIIRLFIKIFKRSSSEEQLDSYIKSIRQKPQYSDLSFRGADKKVSEIKTDLEESGCLVLA